jgi:hypothetical protein
MTEQDKHGQEIRLGDHVYTKIRGGHREGDVEQIVETPEEAKKAGVKNPPKVYIFGFFSFIFNLFHFPLTFYNDFPISPRLYVGQRATVFIFFVLGMEGGRVCQFIFDFHR